MIYIFVEVKFYSPIVYHKHATLWVEAGISHYGPVDM